MVTDILCKAGERSITFFKFQSGLTLDETLSVKIENLQSELDLSAWRIRNSEMKSYTWNQKSPTILCQLDFLSNF